MRPGSSIPGGGVAPSDGSALHRTMAEKTTMRAAENQ